MLRFFSSLSHQFLNFSPISIEKLYRAIKNNHVSTVKSILRNNPDLLFEVNEKGQTPLHIALMQNATSSVHEILQTIIKDKKFKPLLFARDHEGWTILHYASRYGSLHLVNKIIGVLGPKAHEMALAVNFDLGEVPLFSSGLNQTKESKLVKHRVKEITIEKSIVDLTKPIEFSKLISANNSFKSNVNLLRNLHYGCLAASHVRKNIKKSPSHINSNSVSIQEYQSLWSKFEVIRYQYESIRGIIKDKDSNEELFKKLSIMQNYIKAHQIANCFEYACLVAYTLAKIGIKESIEVFDIDKDDHVFTVLGRDQRSDHSNYKSWGDHAVVIDAWSGQVYPASEIPLKLRGFEPHLNSYKTQYRANVFFPFEPRYHSLHRSFELKPSHTKHSDRLNLQFLDKKEVQTYQENEELIKDIAIDIKQHRLK